jgi:RNA polymerase sigma-70 factor (ECF subfamily)
MTGEVEFHDDRALVRAVLAREVLAIQEFTNRLKCVPRILTAQSAKNGRPLDPHDLADLVQDVTVIVLQKLEEYEGRAPLEGWIYRVCCLEFMNGVRRKRRGPRQIEDENLMTPTGPAPEGPDRDLLARAIARVGGVEAEAICLKHFESMTFEEIGARLCVPVSTIKTRYYRGMVKLEEILSAAEGDGSHG